MGRKGFRGEEEKLLVSSALGEEEGDVDRSFCVGEKRGRDKERRSQIQRQIEKVEGR